MTGQINNLKRRPSHSALCAAVLNADVAQQSRCLGVVVRERVGHCSTSRWQILDRWVTVKRMRLWAAQ